MAFVLALDEGTTSARAALYDERGRRLAMTAMPIPCAHPRDGWVEQDARDILDAQMVSARRVLADHGIEARDIAAIGITNQRETTVVWDRVTGAPVAPSAGPGRSR